MKKKTEPREPYYQFRMYLDRNKISQKDVAILIGKTAPVFCQNLNGIRGDLTVNELKIICNHYGISADEYFIKH